MKLSSLLFTSIICPLLAATFSMAHPSPPSSSPSSTTFKTGDGIRLSYTQTGPKHGQPLLFITGWRQTAAEWSKQADYFSSAGFRVTTFDMRGHGDSEEPTFGYRLSRFAADLNDLLTHLNLKKVTVIAHSMGCSVSWAFWDQYPASHRRIAKFVFVDQPAVLVKDPRWTDEQAAEVSALWSPLELWDVVDGIETGAGLDAFIRSMFTASVAESDIQWVLEQNRKMSDKNAAALLTDHGFADWRDVFPRITVPTLMIAGAASVLPPVGVEWIAGQIPGAESYTFSVEEKGSHFMFWENPERFNEVVEWFVKK